MNKNWLFSYVIDGIPTDKIKREFRKFELAIARVSKFKALFDVDDFGAGAFEYRRVTNGRGHTSDFTIVYLSNYSQVVSP